MNNNKLIKKIAFNFSTITGVILVGIVLSKEPIDTKEKYIDVSSLVGINIASDILLIKSKKRKEKN